jgi:serine protease Do
VRHAKPNGIANLTANDLSIDQSFVAVILDPADAALGATLEPASDSLRAQLGIPAGQGLVVVSLAGDGPAADAGLKEKDILLALADKPLASADDLPEQLKAASEAPLRLRIVRAGKPVSLQVRPVRRVTIGPVAETKSEYYIGVGVTPPDETLRTHVDLPDGVGLVATEIVPNSPAEKAGVKTHDILLEMGQHSLDSPETLLSQVKAAGDKTTSLKLLRGGKTLTVTITPELWKVDSSPHQMSLRLWSVPDIHHPHGAFDRQEPGRAIARGNVRITQNAEPAASRLDHLDRELNALRLAIEELRDAFKAGSTKGRE